MPDLLPAPEDHGSNIATSVVQLADPRRGSIQASCPCCSKPNRACTPGDHPGNGPQVRTAFKVHGKSVQQTLPDPARRRTANCGVAMFHRSQKTSTELVNINERFYHLPPAEIQDLAAAPEAANQELQDPGSDRDYPWE